MNEKFLESIIGLNLKDAEEKIVKFGYKTFVVHEMFQAVPAVAIPKIVYLWQEKGIVKIAMIGDPIELEKDV